MGPSKSYNHVGRLLRELAKRLNLCPLQNSTPLTHHCLVHKLMPTCSATGLLPWEGICINHIIKRIFILTWKFTYCWGKVVVRDGRYLKGCTLESALFHYFN